MGMFEVCHRESDPLVRMKPGVRKSLSVSLSSLSMKGDYSRFPRTREAAVKLSNLLNRTKGKGSRETAKNGSQATS